MPRGKSTINYERDARIMELRKHGYTYIQIAQELKVDVRVVYKAFVSWQKQVILPATDELRKAEIENLQSLRRGLDKGIESGDVKAIEVAIRLSERLSKLLGMDQPAKHQINSESPIVIVGLTEADITGQSKSKETDE